MTDKSMGRPHALHHFELHIMSYEETGEKCMTGKKGREVKIRLHKELVLSNVPTPSIV